jgi:hypothetical protein
LILFLFGLVWIWKNRNLSDFLLGEGLLLGTVGLLLIWLSFFNRAQIGIRQVLPFFALDVIIAGAGFVEVASASRMRKSVLAVLLLWLGISFASYYPNMIPYMNEWVVDRKLAYRILADSNLDWDQDKSRVGRYLWEHPKVIESPTAPVSGQVLVGVNELVGVRREESNRFLWLRSRYKPVAQVAYGHLLFNVPPEDFAAAPTQK